VTRLARWACLAVVAVSATSCTATDAVVVGMQPASEQRPVLAPPSPRGANAATGPDATEPDGLVPARAPTVPTPPTTLLGTVPAGLDHLPQPTGPQPVTVRIDPIGISGPVTPVGVQAESGELAVPPVAGVVGWYQYGPAPGESGSAVLAGHVDWHGALGVFFRLAKVEVGSVVTIGFGDGSTRAFQVVERRLVLKPELPVEEVFARSGPPSLVLVTCGGEFDRSRRRYRSNVVVVATPVR
jgi:hypothetical protein